MPIIESDLASSADAPTPTEFITGAAGTGKSYTIRQRQEEDANYCLLTGSTGIAAVNLNTVTINSALKFFDTDSLRDEYMVGKLVARINSLRKSGLQNLVLDEVSMFPGESLDVLVSAFDDANSSDDSDYRDLNPIGLVLVGDFCQLPPIKAKFAFEAQSWHRFNERTTRLEKNWRQGEGTFLAALNAARAGRGSECVELLEKCGVEFAENLDTNFDGTTIVAKNDQVDRYNQFMLKLVPGTKYFSLRSDRWSYEKPPSEWKNIPEQVQLKIGAYVMILANGYEHGEVGPPVMIYANGDCGHVETIDGARVGVRLVRNNQLVYVAEVLRGQETKFKPEWLPSKVTVDDDGDSHEELDSSVPRAEGYYPKTHYNGTKRRFVTAQISYYPLRLAYASTCHKTQGLSLDRVQIDFRDGFFSMPGMAYVAMSRCRTPEGLRLVGSKGLIAKRIKVDRKVEGWL